MRTAAALLLVLGLAVPAAIVEGPAPAEDLLHHGVRHVDDEADGHHHGDADDHHEEPGSPCHHHEDHFCSGHGHDAAFFVASELPGPGLARAPRPVVVEPLDPLSLILVFHIPIA
jgi:hypothetical protein